MKNRDSIIRYYKGGDNGALAARLIDLADSAVKGRPYTVSEFVTPGAVQIGETINAHVSSLFLRTDGGYKGAERVKLCFVRDDYDGPRTDGYYGMPDYVGRAVSALGTSRRIGSSHESGH